MVKTMWPVLRLDQFGVEIQALVDAIRLAALNPPKAVQALPDGRKIWGDLLAGRADTKSLSALVRAARANDRRERALLAIEVSWNDITSNMTRLWEIYLRDQFFSMADRYASMLRLLRPSYDADKLLDDVAFPKFRQIIWRFDAARGNRNKSPSQQLLAFLRFSLKNDLVDLVRQARPHDGFEVLPPPILPIWSRLDLEHSLRSYLRDNLDEDQKVRKLLVFRLRELERFPYDRIAETLRISPRDAVYYNYDVLAALRGLMIVPRRKLLTSVPVCGRDRSVGLIVFELKEREGLPYNVISCLLEISPRQTVQYYHSVFAKIRRNEGDEIQVTLDRCLKHDSERELKISAFRLQALERMDVSGVAQLLAIEPLAVQSYSDEVMADYLAIAADASEVDIRREKSSFLKRLENCRTAKCGRICLSLFLRETLGLGFQRIEDEFGLKKGTVHKDVKQYGPLWRKTVNVTKLRKLSGHLIGLGRVAFSESQMETYLSKVVVAVV